MMFNRSLLLLRTYRGLLTIALSERWFETMRRFYETFKLFFLFQTKNKRKRWKLQMNIHPAKWKWIIFNKMWCRLASAAASMNDTRYNKLSRCWVWYKVVEMKQKYFCEKCEFELRIVADAGCGGVWRRFVSILNLDNSFICHRITNEGT